MSLPRTLRILQLCPKPPLPARDGGCRAMDALTQGLLEAGHKVRVLAAATDKHPALEAAWSPAYREATSIETVYVDTRIHAVDAVTTTLTGDNYQVGRFHAPDLEQRLRDILRREVFDAILVESLFMAPYLPVIRSLSEGCVVLRAHNVEHMIWSRLAASTPDLTRRTYLRWVTRSLLGFERSALAEFDGIAAISEEDAAGFRALGVPAERLHVVPFGIDLDAVPAGATGAPDHVFHFGSMDWTPNVLGVEWLLREVWPAVRPGTQLRLAGKRFPEELRAEAERLPGVEVVGEVEDPWSVLGAAGVAVIPIASGSGMRIKAVEALAAGRPVVTTTTGIEGIPAIHRRHVWIADDPVSFAAGINTLLSDPVTALRLGDAGRELAVQRFANGPIVQDLIAFIRSRCP